MASFLDPTLVAENLRVALSEDFDPRESMILIRGAAGDRRTRQQAWDFVKQHYQQIVARMPADYGARLVSIGRGFCDVQHRQDLEAFFKDKVGQSRGGPRILAQTLERLDQCIALRAVQQDSVTAFLKTQ
jgi:alanyl aminopeptidase